MLLMYGILMPLALAIVVSALGAWAWYIRRSVQSQYSLVDGLDFDPIRIHEIEVDLGFPQSDYRMVGVPMLDTSPRHEAVIKENERLGRYIEDALMPPEERKLREIERQLAQMYAIPSNPLFPVPSEPPAQIQPFDQRYPTDVLGQIIVEARGGHV